MRATREKQASGIVVYLMEELGDARLRTAQLKRSVQESVDLIDKHPKRDEIFEIAGHLIHGIPDTVFKLDKALDASALAAARLDYEEIKQNLKPEKADELEDVLQDVRLQYLKRRSSKKASQVAQNIFKALKDSYLEGVADKGQYSSEKEGVQQAAQSIPKTIRDLIQAMEKPSPLGPRTGALMKLADDLFDLVWCLGASSEDQPKTAQDVRESSHVVNTSRNNVMKNAKEAANELDRLAQITETTGKLPVAAMMKLIAGLERQDRTASADLSKKASVFFRKAANELRGQTNPERLRLAGVLRRVLADGMQMDAGTMLSAIFSQASSREDVMKGFQQANPSMSDEDAQKAADMWERHQNVVKDKHQ